MKVSTFETDDEELVFSDPVPVMQLGNMDLAGRLRPNITNAAGASTEENSAAIATDLAAIENLTILQNSYIRFLGSAEFVGTVPSSVGSTIQKRLAAVPITLVGGSLANSIIHGALAGFRGIIQPYALWSDTADEFTLSFQDEDDAALEPASVNAIQVDVKHPNEAAPIGGTHGVAGDNSGGPVIPLTFEGATANKAIEVDITGGTGGEELGLFLIRWFEV